MEKSTRNWSDAPPEIIGLIEEDLHSIEDCASFRKVCTSWRSAILNNPHCNTVSSKTLPWIMFPCFSSSKGHNFWSLSASKFYKLSLPEHTDRVLSGSNYGWLVLSGLRHIEIFNPLTRASYPLPLLSKLEIYTIGGSYCFAKIVLAATAKDQFLVFGFFPQKLVFTRPGYKTWMEVKGPPMSYADILHLNNQFYVVDTDGFVVQFDITNPIAIEFASPPADIEVEDGDVRAFYLVGILGRLYMVVKFRLRNAEYRCSHFFRAFKLDLGTRKWEEVFSLGDYAIFVDYTTSFSLLVSKYPESRSCIYFMNRYIGHERGSRNMGIFNLEAESLVALYPNYDVVNFFCTPFWFIPKLC